MHAGGNRGGRIISGCDETQRNSASHRFRGNSDIGHHDGIEQLVRKVSARATDAALNFVEYEQRIMARGEVAGGANVFVGKRVDAAFALNELENNAGGAIVHYLLE